MFFKLCRCQAAFFLSYCMQGSQTEGDCTLEGPCTMFLSVASDGRASTQVRHTETSVCIQAQTTSRTSTGTGPEERSCVFLGYNSLCERADAFRELCGVSANVFALLLSVLAAIPTRRTDVPMPQKLVIFLMKLKLGISFASLGVFLGIHRTTVSHTFFLS